ncbi:unnamed protein product [Microthlaspi erraticum]|uniref:F-box associated beta-propeller type 1 domain-containing protein n=1 Tax=Microthlaspi erraticum TaxID=1685480 RepID=A0A6D2JQD4_9BRAS|nr:unnamed protein product [Microthlaspi erraticum]CAA7045779.1 unnamed protein product [Microthlaspi erraticum]
MLSDSRVYSLKFDLQRIDNDYDIVDPSIKQVSVLGQVETSQVFHCHGLLLFVTKDQKLVLWNPYLGQTMSTKRSKTFKSLSRYEKFGLGYDSINGYHKILRVYERKNGSLRSEIYDCNSTSWRVLGVVPEWDITYHDISMSVNGNTYFLALENATKDSKIEEDDVLWSLHCFDFTAERFGPLLPLPFQSHEYSSESVALSCVRDEQLALLFLRNPEVMEFWITTKIDPSSVSWSKFLEVDTRSFPWFPSVVMAGAFFLDEAEKKAVLVSSFRKYRSPTKTCCYQTAYIIGEDGYFKSEVIIGARLSKKCGYCFPFVFTSYVPSLVQLK